MARSNRRRRSRPASIRTQMEQARAYIQNNVVPHLGTHLPRMETEFRAFLLHFIREAQQNDTDAEFSDLVHQAVIMSVIRVLTGNAPTPVDQDHVRYWTYAFRINSLDEDPDQVFAAVVQDELEAAA